MDFQLFGPLHLAILASPPLAAWTLARWAGAGRVVRWSFGAFLAANELAWYAYRLQIEGFRFPEALPLNLCDATLWLTVAAAFTLRRWCVELAFYWSVGGGGMAMLTPDLWAPCPAYPTIYFFCAHGGAIACSLYLIWSRQVRPRPHSPWFAFGALAAFAAFTGLFNVVYHTNYMYLCEKPDAASILDYFGPWPWYLLPSAGLGILLFLALGWRFRRPR